MLRRNFLSLIPAGLLTILTGATLPKVECKVLPVIATNEENFLKEHAYRVSGTEHSVAYSYGTKEWCNFLKVKRDPQAFAFKVKGWHNTDQYGTKRWFNDKGELHRDGDLPAIEYSSGTKAWYANGSFVKATLNETC